MGDLCCSLLVTIVSGVVVFFFLELMRNEVIGSIHLGVSWLSYKDKAFAILQPHHLANLCTSSPIQIMNGYNQITASLDIKLEKCLSLLWWHWELHNYGKQQLSIITWGTWGGGPRIRREGCHESHGYMAIGKLFDLPGSFFLIK